MREKSSRVVFSDEEHARYTEAAKNEGHTLAGWLRMLAFKATRGEA